MKTKLGHNQRCILKLLQELSQGKTMQDISYYGGSIFRGQRCISIGRECSLYNDAPWKIIDLRHAGALFRQEHDSRLGFNTLRTFNGVIHSFIKKGIVSPVPTEIITQGLCNDPSRAMHYVKTERAQQGNIRFVVMNIPNA